MELSSGDPVWTCPECSTRLHEDCARENGRCTVLGCATVVKASPRLDRRDANRWWRPWRALVAFAGFFAVVGVEAHGPSKPIETVIAVATLAIIFLDADKADDAPFGQWF
jgi:hypothetical protein